ncbi:MAG: hypothetical protein UX40_C0011G0002 [Microgenomates group bacterium GW2011_GWF2_46_18]|nr:MAG: hypothetical protein UX40_C0011G0002 [Microgenomates group bacterium GW2011_GWF2_46_18]
MKNALILHGTDFDKEKKQHFNNWFPWLKKKLEELGYKVWLPTGKILEFSSRI